MAMGTFYFISTSPEHEPAAELDAMLPAILDRAFRGEL
jgi:hypothetical protein